MKKEKREKKEKRGVEMKKVGEEKEMKKRS